MSKSKANEIKKIVETLPREAQDYILASAKAMAFTRDCIRREQEKENK